MDHSSARGHHAPDVLRSLCARTVHQLSAVGPEPRDRLAHERSDALLRHTHTQRRRSVAHQARVAVHVVDAAAGALAEHLGEHQLLHALYEQQHEVTGATRQALAPARTHSLAGPPEHAPARRRPCSAAPRRCWQCGAERSASVGLSPRALPATPGAASNAPAAVHSLHCVLDLEHLAIRAVGGT